MDTARFIQLRSIFDEAVKLPSTAWDSYLQTACAGETALMEELRALLDQYRQSPPSMTPGAAPVSSSALTFGPYRVLRELGAGGMGVVYLAVRDDGAFRKNVALKLLRANLNATDVVQRFHQERQVLADLDHINIARILDGGQTREGCPYYVMDYVDGEPLDRYCDSQMLDVGGRIRLFQQVAGAVQYLHEHLVVHRDLKHSNIMVTREGVVKVLDFGIAKVQAHMAAAPDLTSPEFRLLTPNYASPEQISGGATTKASDIYSLGVILYQLLTGRLPHEDPADKLLRDPPLPSANIRQDLQRTPETTNQLRRRIVGDLDQIVLLCLRRDPRQRYASAAELSADLGRFLEGRSVVARREPLMERTVRFLKRKRVAIGVAAALAIALGTGAWQAVLANGQAKLVRSREAEVRRLLDELNRRKAITPVRSGKRSGISSSELDQRVGDVQQLRRLLQQDLAGGGSRSGTLSPERRDILDRASVYLDSVSAHASRDAALALELAGAYQDIGQIYHFGNREKALHAFTNAALLLAGIAAGDPGAGPYREQWLAICDLIRAYGGDVPPWSAPRDVPRNVVADVSVAPRTASRREASISPPINDERPAAPPPPSQPANTAEYDAVRRLFIQASAKAATAEDSMRQQQAESERVGFSLNSDTVQKFNSMRTVLQTAREDLESGNYTAARENILSAQNYAALVIKAGGGR
jgi:serine/threonine protein kinase